MNEYWHIYHFNTPLKFDWYMARLRSYGSVVSPLYNSSITVSALMISLLHLLNFIKASNIKGWDHGGKQGETHNQAFDSNRADEDQQDMKIQVLCILTIQSSLNECLSKKYRLFIWWYIYQYLFIP